MNNSQDTKNSQPEQEPFTYYDPVRDSIRPFRCDGDIPLYTTPPQRTWVGLTATEEQKLLCLSVRNAVLTTASILKEKNT